VGRKAIAGSCAQNRSRLPYRSSSPAVFGRRSYRLNGITAKWCDAPLILRGRSVEDATLRLLTRWRDGDQQAATELFQRHYARLVELAHRHLSIRFAHRIDPEDVAQSVCRTFLTNAQNGKFVLQRSGDLWRLLVAITLHKLQHQVRHHLASKRAVDQERKFGGEDSLLNLQPDLLARDPSPDDAVALVDLLQRSLKGFNPLHRRMIELRLQGHRLEEIAASTGRTRITVIRVLEQFKRCLEQANAK